MNGETWLQELARKSKLGASPAGSKVDIPLRVAQPKKEVIAQLREVVQPAKTLRNGAGKKEARKANED